MCGRDIGGPYVCTNGLNGLDATMSVGSVISIPYGNSPMITNTGTSTNAIFNIAIPQGQPGANGTNGTNGIDAVEGFTNIRINHTASKWLAGVATNMTLTNSGYGLTGGFNGPGVPALNDSFETIEFQLEPGTYTMYVVTSRLSNRGLITWYLDNSVIPLGTMDCYLNGSDTIIQTLSGIVIPSTTRNIHKLKAVITKNVSSTGYYIYLSDIWFK